MRLNLCLILLATGIQTRAAASLAPDETFTIHPDAITLRVPTHYSGDAVHKIDRKDGLDGDNPYFMRHNIARTGKSEGGSATDELNPAYFQRLDRWISAANDRSVLIGLGLGGFPGNSSNWWTRFKTRAREDRYCSYDCDAVADTIVARNIRRLGQLKLPVDRRLIS